MTFELFADKTPRTVKNFIELTKTKYKNTPFHRIIPGFMIQGGDYENGNGTGGASIYGRTFSDENFDEKHVAGVLSMANSGPDTNGSQFFITLDYQPHLDGKHVVFGKIIQGEDVMYKLAKLGSHSGAVSVPVRILKCGVS